MITSAIFKAKARAVLSKHWQTALLIALIVNLPSLLIQGIGTVTNTDPLTRVQLLMIEASSSTAAMNALPDALLKLLSETGVLVMLGLGILVWVVTPALSLGMTHWTLDRIRGMEEPVSTVFSRLRIVLKGIGLRLWITLQVLLWMLPGIAATVLSLIPLYRANAADTASVYSAMRTSSMLIWFGMMLMIVLGAIGYLRYAMADFILADEPEEQVLACARRSKEMMNGRRGALAGLLLSFLVWYLLIILLTGFLASVFGDVVSLVMQMLGSLFLSVYALTAQGVFYEALRLAALRPVQVSAESPDDSGDEPPEDLPEG